MKRQITSAQVDSIVTLHSEGKNQNEIAKELGITQALVSYYLRAKGIRCQSTKSEREKRYEDIKRLALEGYTASQIVKKLGCDRHVVYNAIRKEGIAVNYDYTILPYEKWIKEESQRITECDAEPKQYAEKRSESKVVYFGKKYIDETSLYG